MSSDGGAVWKQIDSLWYNEGGCVLVHPDSANIVFTGGQSAAGYFGVSVSRDSGRTWTRHTLWSWYADICYALTVAPSQTRTLYAGGRGSFIGKVFRSTDLGSTWARTGSDPDFDVYGLAVHPTDPATVVAASASGIHRTTDAGANWTKVNAKLGFYSVRFLSATGDTVAAVGDSGAALSTDGGSTWVDISVGLEGVRVSCLEVVDRPGARLIAGTRRASCWLWDPEVGIEETMSDERGTVNAGPTIVRGVLQLRAGASTSSSPSWLLDAAGRKVMELHPGANDVSGLSPGVYFVREAQAQAQAVQRVVVTK